VIAEIVSPAGAVKRQPALSPLGTLAGEEGASEAASPDVAELSPVTSGAPQLLDVNNSAGSTLNGIHE